MPRKKDEDELTPEEMDSDLKDALREDRQFRKYINIVKHIEETYDLEALGKEATNLHEGRKSRGLPRVPSADALLEAQLQDSSNRGRLTRILADLVNQEGILDEATDAIRAHMAFTYAEMLPSARTKAERLVYLNKYLRRGMSLEHKIKTLYRRIELYVVDIDKMGYTFTNSKDILKMIYESKGRQA